MKAIFAIVFIAISGGLLLEKISKKIKKMSTTENISFDGIMYGQDVYRTHCTQKTGTTLATVIGILLGLIVLAILWSVFVGRDRFGKSTEKETNVNLGENNEAIDELRHEVRVLKGYERADYGKIMFNDGWLYGGGECGFEHGRGRKRGGCGCGERHEGGCDSKFQIVKTFGQATETAQQTSTCYCG